MKQFFKFMFASMAGLFLSSIIVLGLFFLIIASVANSTKKQETSVKANSVLHLKLNKTIKDRAQENPFAQMDFNSFNPKTVPGLLDVLNSIEKAKGDDNIKGIFLDLSVIPSGLASIEEMRDELMKFKESEKFIVAYSEVYSQKAYYLASVADKVYIHPEGAFDFRGFQSQLMFLKGALAKLEIEPQIIRHGKFKSAIEPLILEEMSEANEEQALTYLQDMWDQNITGISQMRNLTTDQLNNIADDIKIRYPKDAKKMGLVDEMFYRDQVMDEIKDRLELDKKKDINFVSLGKYKGVKSENKKKATRNKIAVVYAEGDIVSGEGSDDNVGSAKIAKAIAKARKNDKVKAVVLRVNSPGGSALASDVILREVVLTKQEKPVIVSMGNVAASGGYYIACISDKVFASENTITGSIGVFGVIPNMQGFFNNKLGITFDGVETNEHADLISTTRPMTEFEYDLVQESVEEVYSTFIGYVSEGRNMTLAQVDSIGQGRVWSGHDAKDLGLIDEFGGLKAAIEEAAKLAEVEDYRIYSLPKQKDILEEIMSGFSVSLKESLLKSYIGDENFESLKTLEKWNSYQGVMMRLPYEETIR